MEQLEYAFYQENFEIFQFKFKTYGCGKWAKTYNEAHELAKECVIKKCMEENPHLTFGKQVNGNHIPDVGKMMQPIPGNYDNAQNVTWVNHPNNIPIEKINKATIEEQIQASKDLDELDGWKLLAKSNKKLQEVFNQREKELINKQTV